MKVLWWILVGYTKLIMSKLRMLNKKKRELYDKRYETCKFCKYLSSQELCKICGCYVKAKTKVDKAVCPKGYW